MRRVIGNVFVLVSLGFSHWMLPRRDLLRITSLIFAVGASWQTTITYINYSPQEVSCQTDFFSDHGSPLMVSFAGLGLVVSRADILQPWGSVHEETDGDLSAPLAPGWARATCSGPVKASLLFRQHNSEGVPTAEAAGPELPMQTLPPQAAHVTFTARDAAGQMLAS